MLLLVPDCQIVLPPTESDLKIVVLSYELQDCKQVCERVAIAAEEGHRSHDPGDELTVSLQYLALLLCNIVDPSMLDLMRRAEQALPAGDWVRAHHRTENRSMSVI